MTEFNPLGELSASLLPILNETITETNDVEIEDYYSSSDESECLESEPHQPIVDGTYNRIFIEDSLSFHDEEQNQYQPLQLKALEQMKSRQLSQTAHESFLVRADAKDFNVNEDEGIMKIKKNFDRKYDRNMKNLESSRQQSIIVKRYLDYNEEILKFTDDFEQFSFLIANMPDHLQKSETFRNSRECRTNIETQLKRFENKSYNQISELENAFAQLENEMVKLDNLMLLLQTDLSQYKTEILNQIQLQQTLEQQKMLQQQQQQQQQLLQHKIHLSQNQQTQIQTVPQSTLATSTPLQQTRALSISENFFSLSSLKSSSKPIQSDIPPTEMIKYLEGMESKCSAWEKTWPKTKTLNFKRLANTTVNAISSQDMDSLMDKISKLDILLSGKTLTALDQTVRLDSQEEVEYCSNLITTKLIKKGEQEVSSNPKAAHPIASVVVCLCSKHQTLAKLLLGSLYRACPIMAPIFPQQGLAPNSKEFLLSTGYKVKDNQLEDSGEFSNRIKGLFRLYTCIMQFPIEGISSVFSIPSHFYGINKAWTWMVQVLQGPMVPGVSEVALHAAFEVMGYRMTKIYGNQFIKLVYLARNEFLPNLKRFSPPEHNPSIARLQKFLDDHKTVIPESDGAFSDGFWVKNVFKI